MITLIRGDCLDVLPGLAGRSVDLIFVDLPYGATSRPWDRPIDMALLWPQYRRLLRRRGVVLLHAAQPFASLLVAGNLRWFRCDWVWRKTRASNFGSARYQPLRKHESVLVFAPEPHKYNPIKRPGAPYRSRTQHPRDDTKYGRFGDADYQPGEVRASRHPDTILEFPSMRQQDLVHPTQKPLALAEYLMRTYSDAGDVVLDHCFGSGTVGQAAVRGGRDFVGVESDPAMFDLGSARIRSEVPLP